jgi:type IV secretion system protein VirB9
MWSCAGTHFRVTGISRLPHPSGWESYQVVLDSNDFDYRLSGDAAYRPQQVFNDGQHTYLIYPNDGRFRELPTLLIQVNGKSELVNFRVDGSRYIVDRLFDKAILVVGVGKKQTRVTITRATPFSGSTGKRS